MSRKKRLQYILDKLNKDGSIIVTDLVNELHVSDMTIRRDLDKLAVDNLLVRVHGGAIQKDSIEKKHEKSHYEKQVLQVEAKKEIAQIAERQIVDGETIFMGPGTTLESLAKVIKDRAIRVITNSLPVFLILKDSPSIDLMLIGGEYREITGAFVGSMALKNVRQLHFSKTFVSANGFKNNMVATYSELEGDIQNQALDNAMTKYLLLDHTKFDQFDFYNFYDVADVDYIICDKSVSDDERRKIPASTALLQE